MGLIVIVDFGCRGVKMLLEILQKNKVCHVVINPTDSLDSDKDKLSGIILSGGPLCVLDDPLPDFDYSIYNVPVLGICYGAQLIAKKSGGTVERKHMPEFGRIISRSIKDNELVPKKILVWMSHHDTITHIPDAEILSSTDTNKFSAFKVKQNIYGVQFHPESIHTENGHDILKRFINICKIEI